MLALVGLCEAFVAGPSLRFARIEPDDWQSAAATAKHGCPAGGVLILGDSQVKFGISPLQVEAAVGQPVQCLAIQGGRLRPPISCSGKPSGAGWSRRR